MKLHIFPHVIESYPAVSGLCSCIEKNRSLWQPILQWPCTLVAQCHFLHFQMLLFFSLTSYHDQIAYLNSPNRGLSNGVRLMKLYWNKLVDPSRSPCLKTVDWKPFERRNFLVLHPVLLKNAYFSSANRQLSIAVQIVELGWRKIVDSPRGAP